jgi:hypothetical protein
LLLQFVRAIIEKPVTVISNKVGIIVSFRQACMTLIKKDATIGYSTIQKRITDVPKKPSSTKPKPQRG